MQRLVLANILESVFESLPSIFVNFHYIFYENSIYPEKSVNILNVISAVFSILSLSWAIKDSYLYILGKKYNLSS